MDQQSAAALQQFNSLVSLKYERYNGLFRSLPFHGIEETGVLLSMLSGKCEDGFKKKENPVEIIDQFFNSHTSYSQEKEKLNVLFRFVQYSERQLPVWFFQTPPP